MGGFSNPAFSSSLMLRFHFSFVEREEEVFEMDRKQVTCTVHIASVLSVGRTAENLPWIGLTSWSPESSRARRNSSCGMEKSYGLQGGC